jgi:hypothetical protein
VTIHFLRGCGARLRSLFETFELRDETAVMASMGEVRITA